MGKLQLNVLRYLEPLDFRILTAIELGMKNHELVSGPLVTQLANVRSGGVHKKLMELCRHRLCCYERGKHYDGYRLTNLGYDYLSLKVLSTRDVIVGAGSQIGVGKESDIYVVTDREGDQYCMKIHRLGRTSFRKLREKRDYHGNRGKAPWIYLSRLSATKEYVFMSALREHGFPVPKPVDFNRHIIIMELVNGFPLNQIREVKDPGQLYSDLMELIVRLANHGVIHSDFNEFNIMIDDNDKPIIIDFPQMVSTEHLNAQMYFDRDVKCIVDFFKRRFDYESELKPDFTANVVREVNLDKEVAASGYSKEVKQFDMECIDDGVSDGSGSVVDDSCASESNLDPNNLESLKLECNNCHVASKLCSCRIDDSLQEEEFFECSENITAETSQLVPEECTQFFDSIEEQTNCDIKSEGISQDIKICSDFCDKRGIDRNDVNADKPDNEGENCEKDHYGNSNIACGRQRSPSPTESVISKCMSRKNRAVSPSSRSALISEIASIRERRRKGELEDSCSILDFATNFRNDDGRASHVSGSTTASSIPLEQIKRRAKGDLLRSLSQQKCSKKGLRAKGEANACNRSRKDNMQEIKESLGWDEY